MIDSGLILIQAPVYVKQVVEFSYTWKSFSNSLMYSGTVQLKLKSATQGYTVGVSTKLVAHSVGFGSAA